jgi:hypothetical protein
MSSLSYVAPPPGREIHAPHFDLPFRFSFNGRGGSAAVVEQGTIDDLANNVFLMVATPQGYRDEAPNFGTPDMVFRQQPVASEAITSIIRSQDQRIEFAFQEHRPVVIDELVSVLKIAVATRSIGPSV